MLDPHQVANNHWLTRFNPPSLVSSEGPLVGTGNCQSSKQDFKQHEKMTFGLIPTAEVPVRTPIGTRSWTGTSLRRSLAAFTPCFRRGAASTPWYPTSVPTSSVRNYQIARLKQANAELEAPAGRRVGRQALAHSLPGKSCWMFCGLNSGRQGQCYDLRSGRRRGSVSRVSASCTRLVGLDGPSGL